MIPAYARRAHVRLIQVMKDLAAYNESSDLHTVLNPGSSELGVLSSGVSVQHVLEAAPEELREVPGLGEKRVMFMVSALSFLMSARLSL